MKTTINKAINNQVTPLDMLLEIKDLNMDSLPNILVDFDCTIYRGRTMQEVIDSNPYSK